MGDAAVVLCHGVQLFPTERLEVLGRTRAVKPTRSRWRAMQSNGPPAASLNSRWRSPTGTVPVAQYSRTASRPEVRPPAPPFPERSFTARTLRGPGTTAAGFSGT